MAPHPNEDLSGLTPEEIAEIEELDRMEDEDEGYVDVENGGAGA